MLALTSGVRVGKLMRHVQTVTPPHSKGPIESEIFRVDFRFNAGSEGHALVTGEIPTALRLERIRSLRAVGRSRVYDLTVQGSENFVAEGFVVHNTRWHPGDIIGELAEEEGWEYINLPAISEADDLLGRTPGEALWSARYPIAWLDAQRELLGEWSFAALYQGHPRPRGHHVFEQPTYYDPATFKIDGHRIFIGADPAASDKTTADHTAAVAIALKGHGEQLEGVVLDVLRGQWQVPEAIAKLHAFQLKWYGAPLGVEAVGGFKAVPQLLARIDPKLKVYPLPATGDKFQRAQAVAAAWNAGRLRVPTSAPWLKDYVKELCDFTGVGDAVDDVVDATAYAWNQAALPYVPVQRGAVAQPQRWR